MTAEELFLQGPARPLCERRVTRVEDRFVEERDDGVDGELDILGRISGATRLLMRATKQLLDVIAALWRLARSRTVAVKTS